MTARQSPIPVHKVPSPHRLPDSLSQYAFQCETNTMPPLGEDRSDARLAIELDNGRVYFPGQQVTATLFAPLATVQNLRELWSELRVKVYAAEASHVVLFTQRTTILPEGGSSHQDASFERLSDDGSRARWSLRFKIPLDIPADTLDFLIGSRLRVRGDSIPLPPTFVGALTRSGGRHGPEASCVVYAIRAGGEAVVASGKGGGAVAATSSKAAALIGAAIRPFSSKPSTAAAIAAQGGRIRAKQPIFVLPFAPTLADPEVPPRYSQRESEPSQVGWVTRQSRSTVRSKDGKLELSVKVRTHSPSPIAPGSSIPAHISYILSHVGRRQDSAFSDAEIDEQTRAFERNIQTTIYLRQLEECDFKSVTLLGSKNTNEGGYLSSIPLDVQWEEASEPESAQAAPNMSRRSSTITTETDASTLKRTDSTAHSETTIPVPVFMNANGKGTNGDANGEHADSAPAWQRVWVRKALISARPGAAITPIVRLPTLHTIYMLVLRLELGPDASSSTSSASGRVLEVDLGEWNAVSGVSQKEAADPISSSKIIVGNRWQELQALSSATATVASNGTHLE